MTNDRPPPARRSATSPRRPRDRDPQTTLVAPDYRAVFAALSAPKVLLAPDLTVLDVNDAYLEMLGLPATSLVGRPLNDGFTFNPDDEGRVDRVVASLRHVLQTGRIDLLEPLRIDVPGDLPGTWVERHWLMTNIPVFDASGRVSALVHRAEDVTDIVHCSQQAAADDHVGWGTAVVDHALHLGSTVGRFQESLDRERRAALQLQDSILTPPVQPDGLRIDVRYRPASREIHVGGDWYDAFELSCGCAFVVVGDVVGHDVSAAATMGQLRGVMRGIAYDSDESPAAILDRTERTTKGLRVAAVATVAAARIGRAGPAGDRELTWACAGHLPPVLLRADGHAELLERHNDRLLGVGTDSRRSDHTALLHPGDVLLLYTDGLIERRGERLRDALRRFPLVVEEIARSSREGLVDALLARLVPQASEDDIALVAVEVLPSGDAAR
ncbi:SpoIIE family protein phosphatase [Oerskovia sp. Sa1BUA8]|uniref:SpoIIE family protein phosphatase n=1 Tax=Oerskovia douganii TaxID=2762210 RepID=A0A9D5Z1A1_9CELL|nr:SpoIIE family protein phosphatase [Oerskovia douganii]MBE7702296.1 SpoIIE family protein phosphatase [Oerskovia douganii]